jgi:hypothetical protein
MKPYEQSTNSASTLDQLKQVRMIPSDRRRASAYLRQAELFADTLLRADAQLRHAFGFVGRGIVALAHRRKVHTL